MVVLRLVQGVAMGGEQAGAFVMVAEADGCSHRREKRGLERTRGHSVTGEEPHHESIELLGLLELRPVAAGAEDVQTHVGQQLRQR